MAEDLEFRDASDIGEQGKLCKERRLKKPRGAGLAERLRICGRQAWILPENGLFLSRITNVDRLA